MKATGEQTLAQVRSQVVDLCAAGDFLGAFLLTAGSRYSAADFPGLWELLARRLADAGEARLAGRTRQLLRDAGTLRGQVALDEVRQLLDDGQSDQAILVLDTAFGRQLREAEVNLLYADALMSQDRDAAVEHLLVVPTDTPANALSVIDGLRQAGRLVQAMDLIAVMQAQYPGDARFAIRRARVLERRNEWSAALTAWQDVADTAVAFRVEALTKVMLHSRRLEDDAGAATAFAALARSLQAGLGATDLLRKVEALETMGQPEAVAALLDLEAGMDRRRAIPAAQWRGVAQALLDSGRLGLVGWMIAQGLPVGAIAEAVFRAAPLTDVARKSVARDLTQALALVSPDALLPALAAACPDRALPVRADDRVLLVNSTLAAGGAERQFLSLIRALLRDGLSAGQLHVALFSVAEDRGHAHFLPDVQRTGVTVHVLPDRPPDQSQVPETALVAALPLHLRGDVLRLAPLVRDLRPGVIHGWQDRSSLAGGLAGLLYHTPRIVLSARNMRPELRREGRLHLSRALMRQICQTPAAVLTVNSAAGVRDYATWLDLPPDRVRRLNNGLDLDAFHMVPKPTRKRSGNAAPVEILGVFRIAGNKRPVLWLRTVAALRERLDFAIRPRIVGSGPFYAQLLQERDRLGLTDLVLDRRLDDPMRIYGTAGMLLLMSRVEGTPNVVIEAQACGLPVAACDVGGVSEAMLQNGPAAGLLLPAEIDPEAAAGQIATWLPQALCAAPGPRRDHVMQAYGMGALSEHTVALYGLVRPAEKDTDLASVG